MVFSPLLSCKHKHKYDQTCFGHCRQWAIQVQPKPNVFELSAGLCGNVATCQFLCDAGPHAGLHAMAHSVADQTRRVVLRKALWRGVFKAQKIDTQVVVVFESANGSDRRARTVRAGCHPLLNHAQARYPVHRMSPTNQTQAMTTCSFT